MAGDTTTFVGDLDTGGSGDFAAGEEFRRDALDAELAKLVLAKV